MEQSVPQKLQTYINAEMGDAMLYTELAKMAPNEQDRKLILSFAEDELAHAQTFKRIYKLLTGQSYEPSINPPMLDQPYEDIIRSRVMDESGDFRKYGEQYLTTMMNPMLKNAYYRARTDENVHALRLLSLLTK